MQNAAPHYNTLRASMQEVNNAGLMSNGGAGFVW